MIQNKISLMIGGEAGAGITRSGSLFGKACMRGGYHVFGTIDYQSLIRGGHNFYIVRVDAEKVHSQNDSIDLLLALNTETILLHINEVVTGGGIVFDEEESPLNAVERKRNDIKLYSVPMRQIIKELAGVRIMRNTIALGAAIGLINYDLKIMEEVLRDTFRPNVAESNIKALNRGYDYAKEHYEADFDYQLNMKVSKQRKILLTGNEAVGLGALQAGCKFYAAYPMTPATGVLHFLAPLDRQHNMIVIQAESEIAAINMVAGASFAGARAMTATSGGGFSLMSEGFGMLGMTETPAVIMIAQRPGPSTGLPTYTGQGDLRFAIHASQGEFPRLVIAPGDIKECFYKTIEAFHLADKYQIPAILITDKHLAESHQSIEPFIQTNIDIEREHMFTTGKNYSKEEYRRHRFTEEGISLRATPGTEGIIVRTNATEHDETGYATDNAILARNMMDKRFKKLDVLITELHKYETTKLYGKNKADATILGWGSTKGPIREALKQLNKDDQNINYLQIIYLAPFPTQNVLNVLKTAEQTIVVENNKTSQLSSLIREHTLTKVDHKILKYDGRPFHPLGLAKKISDVL